jgi:hypothetical protein
MYKCSLLIQDFLSEKESNNHFVSAMSQVSQGHWHALNGQRHSIRQWRSWVISRGGDQNIFHLDKQEKWICFGQEWWVVVVYSHFLHVTCQFILYLLPLLVSPYCLCRILFIPFVLSSFDITLSCTFNKSANSRRGDSTIKLMYLLWKLYGMCLSCTFPYFLLT